MYIADDSPDAYDDIEHTIDNGNLVISKMILMTCDFYKLNVKFNEILK